MRNTLVVILTDPSQCPQRQFKSADGRFRWNDGILKFELFKNAQDQIDHVLQHQTSFVQANWFRIEVVMPNRDAHGQLRPGWISDKECMHGILLA